jgi:hypothetical protein
VPTRLSARQRSLLEDFAAESGELEPTRGADDRPGRKPKRGLADRLKGAIT